MASCPSGVLVLVLSRLSSRVVEQATKWRHAAAAAWTVLALAVLVIIVLVLSASD